MPETAIDKLKRMTAWDADPPLSEGELDGLLADAARTDAAGLAPLNEEWTPTYDLNVAASAGWLAKAAKASGLTEVDPPGSGLFTAKVFDNCCRMARIYASKRGLTVRVNRTYT